MTPWPLLGWHNIVFRNCKKFEEKKILLIHPCALDHLEVTHKMWTKITTPMLVFLSCHKCLNPNKICSSRNDNGKMGAHRGNGANKNSNSNKLLFTTRCVLYVCTTKFQIQISNFMMWWIHVTSISSFFLDFIGDMMMFPYWCSNLGRAWYVLHEESHQNYESYYIKRLFHRRGMKKGIDKHASVARWGPRVVTLPRLTLSYVA